MIPTCIRQQNILWTVNNLSLTISSGKFEAVSKIKSCHPSRAKTRTSVLLLAKSVRLRKKEVFTWQRNVFMLLVFAVAK